MAVHAVVVALIGGAATIALARWARRRAVAHRLRVETRRRGLLPAFVRAPLAAALENAVLGWSPEEAVETWGFACGIAALVGLGLSPACSVLAAIGVAVGLPVLLVGAGARRSRLLAAAVPDALEEIGAELRVGGTVPRAIATLARGEGPLALDMARVESRVELGASLSDALHAWASERPVVGVDAAAGALALGTQLGGRAADALDGLAASLRARLAVAAETRALSAQARASAWVIGLAPVGYFVITMLIDPRSIHALLGTNAGRVCGVVGLGLELLGAWWMRVILRGGEA